MVIAVMCITALIHLIAPYLAVLLVVFLIFRELINKNKGNEEPPED